MDIQWSDHRFGPIATLEWCAKGPRSPSDIDGINIGQATSPGKPRDPPAEAAGIATGYPEAR